MIIWCFKWLIFVLLIVCSNSSQILSAENAIKFIVLNVFVLKQINPSPPEIAEIIPETI